MSICAKATVNLEFVTEKQLIAIASAIAPETQMLPTKRAKAKLERNGNQLTLVVTAKDTIALRATLNTYLGWIKSTLNVINAAEKE